MANTGKISGRNASFRLTDLTGAAITLTGDGNEVTLSYSAALLDTTAYGDTTITTLADILDYTVNFSGYADLRGATSSTCKLMQLVGASAGTCFMFAPAGSIPCADGACPTYSGCVNVESLDIGTPRAGLITRSFTLRPRAGDLTVTAGSWTA